MTHTQIKELRQKTGLGLAEFGQLFGVVPSTILSWEKGTGTPSNFVLAAMVQLQKQVLGKERDDLKNTLKNFLIAGGILAFLMWLFNQKN